MRGRHCWGSGKEAREPGRVAGGRRSTVGLSGRGWALTLWALSLPPCPAPAWSSVLRPPAFRGDARGGRELELPAPQKSGWVARRGEAGVCARGKHRPARTPPRVEVRREPRKATVLRSTSP